MINSHSSGRSLQSKIVCYTRLSEFLGQSVSLVIRCSTQTHAGDKRPREGSNLTSNPYSLGVTRRLKHKTHNSIWHQRICPALFNYIFVMLLCTQVRKHASEGSTLSLKSRADVTKSSKLGYQRPHKKDISSKNF